MPYFKHLLPLKEIAKVIFEFSFSMKYCDLQGEFLITNNSISMVFIFKYMSLTGIEREQSVVSRDSQRKHHVSRGFDQTQGTKCQGSGKNVRSQGQKKKKACWRHQALLSLARGSDVCAQK